MWRLRRGAGFRYHTPAEWAVNEPTTEGKDGADFEIGLYVIGNKKGLEEARHNATSEGGAAWNKVHDLLKVYMEEAELNPYDAQYLGLDSHKANAHKLSKTAKLRIIARFPVGVTGGASLRKVVRKEDSDTKWHLFKAWYTEPEPRVRKYDKESSVYTDGGVGKSRAGAGIYWEGDDSDSSHVWEGWQNAPVAELVAIRTAVDNIASKMENDKEKVWHIFSDSLTILMGLSKFKRNPRSMRSNPYYKTFLHISDVIRKHNLNIHFHKVKGHIGINGNERADRAATKAYSADNIEKVAPLFDPPGGVRLYGYSIEKNKKEEDVYVRTEFTQTNHLKQHVKRNTPFRARTITPWRSLINGPKQKHKKLFPIHRESKKY